MTAQPTTGKLNANEQPQAPLVMRQIVAGYGANDVVLNEVDIEVRRGLVTVILGPNGSGKSTALRVLAGFLRARSGVVQMDGADITLLSPQERIASGLAYLPQGRSVFPELTVEENLRLGTWLIRRDTDRADAAVEAVFERYPRLQPVRRRPAASLSGGQARMLEFGRSLMLDPRVLLVDEPSVGLAPVLVNGIYEEISRLKEEGRTVLLVDQNVRAAVDVADYVYTLTYGRNHLEGEVGTFAGSLDALISQWLSL